jgi:hypothetical protein
VGVYSPDVVVPAPPLTAPPLSLVSICDAVDRVIETDTRVVHDALVDGPKVTSTSARFTPADMGAQVTAVDSAGRPLGPGRVIRSVIDASTVELDEELGVLDGTTTTLSLASMLPERWVGGFQFLPEPTAAAGTEAPGLGSTDPLASTQVGSVGYDPFLATYHDTRSVFGWGAADYAARARRGLVAHEAFQVEQEFWAGLQIPSNPHLSASANTPAAGKAGRSASFAAPTAPPGTTLGTAVGLSQSLAALDQAIAESDAGVGMIHCTPYLLQQWAKVFQLIREKGLTYTVNYNLIVPGYGYPGTGPDVGSRQVTDGATTNGSPNVSSATGAFTGNDLGRTLTGTGIPTGATIVTITDSTHVVLSKQATATASGVTFTIDAGAGRQTGGTQQWAYATDLVALLRGPLMQYPHTGEQLTELSPAVPQHNAAEFRAERAWAAITNGACRAAVLVDTTIA